MKKLKVILIGAGGRGRGYTDLMAEIPDKYEIVAVAEPIECRRNYIRDKHNVPENMCFPTWEPLLAMDKFADVAMVCTMDRDHYAPTMAAIEKGYDMLLEKPVAPTPEQCIAMANAAKEKGVKILVCHVLRYTFYFRKLKELIDNGTIGRVMSIQADECVGNVHQSHSFVRGNWRNEQESSFMLLQKCCHDMDVLQWLLGKKCTKAHSFGSLTYFNSDNAPEGSTEYCYNCPCKDECYYDAAKIYNINNTESAWMLKRATDELDASQSSIDHMLRTTDFGKCVFRSNNNVVDHQVVNLEFEDGATVSFSMNAFNEGGRHIRINGTKGELVGDAGTSEIDFYDFATRKHTLIKAMENACGDSIATGHGGGDGGIILDLYKYLTGEIGAEGLSEIGISAENHMIAFAAEHSRLTGTVVDVDEFVKSLA